MRYFTILITCSPVQTHSSLSFVHVWWPRRANIYFWETEHCMSNQMCFNLFTYVHGLSVYVCLCSRLFFPSARDLLLNFSLKTHHRGYYTRFGGLQMRMWFWLLWLNIFSLRHTNTRTAHKSRKTAEIYIRRLSAQPHTKYSSQKIKSIWIF